MVRFFMSIDSTLFNFIATLYDLLIAISRTSVLSQGDIAQFASRIEILLGIFMLFKMSFSLITYIVNPDDFTDKQKGFGKLIQNSVISLVLLVLVPYIFQMAFSLQAKILNDNLLAKLLLGEKLTDNENTDNSKATLIDKAGEQMAFQVMLPFFKPNYSINDDMASCISIYDSDGSFNSECSDALTSTAPGDNNEIIINNYAKGIEYGSLGLTFRASVALLSTKEDQFLIDYKYPLSTATAVITCLLLITFCIDVGVRSVKLAFLQLIYPIPVISFMDPKSGKDGIFSKWYKMCLSTFLSLFIRLLALYFGIYIITQVGKHGMIDIINGSEVTDGWVILFVIIGILMFIKQMPKILENLGIKIDGEGSFSLNPLKKVLDEKNGAFGAKRIASAAGGFAVGAMHGRALRGLVSGARGGKGFGDAAKAEADHARRLREARNNGSTMLGRMGARLSNVTGFRGKADRLSQQDKKIEEKSKNMETLHGNFDKAKSSIKDALESGKMSETSFGRNYNDLRAKLDTAKKVRDSINKDDYKDSLTDKQKKVLAGIERKQGESKEDYLARRSSARESMVDENFKAAIEKASSAVYSAESALGKYTKEATADIYNQYMSGKVEGDYNNDIGRAIDQLKGEASAQGYGSNYATYESADKNDNYIQNEIVKNRNERSQLRDARERAAADKSAIGKQ